VPIQRCVALLAGLRGQGLIPRASFFQLHNIRQARAAGVAQHLIAHEDVLLFRRPATEARQCCELNFPDSSDMAA
jgi:modification methylase